MKLNSKKDIFYIEQHTNTVTNNFYYVGYIMRRNSDGVFIRSYSTQKNTSIRFVFTVLRIVNGGKDSIIVYSLNMFL